MVCELLAASREERRYMRRTFHDTGSLKAAVETKPEAIRFETQPRATRTGLSYPRS